VNPHRLDRPLRWRAAAAVALALGGLLLAQSTGDALAVSSAEPEDLALAASASTVRVVVEAHEGRLAAATSAATALGGTVVATQNSLGTLVADVPSAAVARLRTSPAVLTVTEDSRLQLQSTGIGPTGTAGDMTNVAKLTGATTFWRNGFSGQGIDVALLDSGVLPVEGMMTANKLVIGPDLSLESQTPTLEDLDTFGHGTHMAGIIAGRDSGSTSSTYAADNTRFLGMAPSSRIVSIKLADAQGNTDVSQVIAAIDWVVAHSHDAGLNIRVLNLSFGTDSTQDYRLDPLAHAAEVAWASGIVVVVSAGNGGGTTTGLANPAYDPAVLAVGAVNTQGTADRTDDRVPAFSQRGAILEGKRAPDLVAPGSSIVSLRAPGSFVDIMHGDTGTLNSRFFRGSGTSQAAAVVSGASALLLSQRPWLSPDQLKDILRRSAYDVPEASVDAQGAGGLDLAAAYTTSNGRVAAARVHAGGGSLDKARGTKKVKKNGVTLTGEQDIFGTPTDTGELAEAEVQGTAGATWAGGQWTGPPLLGATWAGTKWSGATWAGTKWSGATWAGATWAGATWADAYWTGATWAGATWAGATWADAYWANDLWSSASWG
jgi:serine protease AprX